MTWYNCKVIVAKQGCIYRGFATPAENGVGSRQRSQTWRYWCGYAAFLATCTPQTAVHAFANPQPFWPKRALRKKHLTNRINQPIAHFLTAPNSHYATFAYQLALFALTPVGKTSGRTT